MTSNTETTTTAQIIPISTKVATPVSTPTVLPFSNLFLYAFKAIVGEEGVLSTDKEDRGNYTPKGVFKGTKYGISAHAYSNLDIANLTLDDARAIYHRDYWVKIEGDMLGSMLAISALDTVINLGVSGGLTLLEGSLRLPQNGIMTNALLQSVHSYAEKYGMDDLVANFLAARLRHYLTKSQADDLGGLEKRTIKIGITCALYRGI